MIPRNNTTRKIATTMKRTPVETADTDTGTVDTVPAAEQDTAPVTVEPTEPARRRGRPKGSTNRRPTDTAATTGRPSKNAQIARALESQYVLVGSLLVFAAPSTGRAMIENAEACSQALAAWAATNPKVARALERTMTGAGAVSVIAAHAPIALAAYADITARTGPGTGSLGAPGIPDLSVMFGPAPTPAPPAA